METAVCRNCNTPALEQAVFCYKCGEQLKCAKCLVPVVVGANHCISCGASVSITSGNEPVKSINQIKFRENKDERWYEINFSNDVGKEIKEVVADILKNKIGRVSGSQIKISQIDYSPERVQVEAEEEPESNELISKTEKVGKSPIPISSPNFLEAEPTYPHLNDLDIRLNCTENEWLLIYAFYHSGYGTATFAKEPIWQTYKDKRLTETRFKNLGTNWKSLFKKHLSTVRENEFKFTTQGLAKVKSLLLSEQDKSKTLRVPRQTATTGKDYGASRRMPISRKVVATSIVPDEFDVYKNNLKVSLEEFFAQKHPGSSNPNRIVTIAYYITKINHQEYFTEGNIDFAYRILHLGGKPVHLKQIITNLKNDRIWFKKVIDQGTTGWRLTRQGEIYVEEKMFSS